MDERGEAIVGTVGALLADAARQRGEETFLIYGDESYSFAEVDARANGVAATLGAWGIHRGDRVAVLAGNSPELLLIWFGLAKLGGIMIPMDPGATRAGVGAFLTRADPSLLVFDRARRELAADVSKEPGMPAPRALEDVVAAQDGPPPAVDVSPDDVVVMLPTSGTTGVSKLVMQTHRAFVLAGEGFPSWVGLEESDRLMTPLPLFHLNALAYSTMGALCAGVSLVLLPRFSASRFLDEARRHQATVFNAVGAILEILMRRPERDDDPENPLRLCYAAPAPSNKERHLEIEKRFDFRIMAGYGLSETPYGTVWPLTGAPPYGSMGSLKQHPQLGEINHARVVGEEGRSVEPGEAGELLLKNPAVMKGYFRMPRETESVLEDGWLRTGDLVRSDENGLFYFVARKKDIIRRRGENISPSEVEGALVSHPSVIEAAVVAVPSELGEDDIKAYVVTIEGAKVSVGALEIWVEQQIGRSKVPSHFEFVNDLPRTPTGRVAKHLLDRSP